MNVAIATSPPKKAITASAMAEQAANDTMPVATHTLLRNGAR